MVNEKTKNDSTISFLDKLESSGSIFFKHKIPKNINKKERVDIFTLTKHEDNPIMKPNEDNWWESWQVFNPGVVMLDGDVHIIYRSIGEDGVSRFGYALSENGFQVDQRILYPIYQHLVEGNSFYCSASGGSWSGCEDPRLVQVEGDDTIYMTYTACEGGLRVALTSIKVEDFKKRKWRWSAPQVISPKGQVHKNWVIFPEKINGKYAILHSISPEISIEYRDSLEFEKDETIESFYKNNGGKKDQWESWIRGVGPPPLKTKYGWLIFYHAIDKKETYKYKLGAMLTDLNDPSKILYRAKSPILEPNEDYENNGFKAGIIYASGAVIKDEKIYIYYGGSDSYICVAYCDLEEFLQELMKDNKPKLKRKAVKKKL